MRIACRSLLASIGCSLCVAALPAVALAQDATNGRIRTQTLTSQLHVLFGVGDGVIAGNILVSIGEQGVFMVDDQFPGIAPKYKEAISELGGGAIDFVVNTHWHFDHADGNKLLGPEGVWLVSHENSRAKLTVRNVINLVNQTIDQPAFDIEALPVVTFEDSMSFHFNGERIDLVHFGPAHTDGDAAVIFRDTNVVHLGDVFNNSGYPFIDADNGGSLPGLIAFCEAVLEELDRTAIVVPGHGPVADYEGLVDYIEMLSTIRDRVAALISSGASLEQVVAARITSEWDEEMGDPSMFLNRAYASMSR